MAVVGSIIDRLRIGRKPPHRDRIPVPNYDLDLNNRCADLDSYGVQRITLSIKICTLTKPVNFVETLNELPRELPEVPNRRDVWSQVLAILHKRNALINALYDSNADHDAAAVVLRTFLSSVYITYYEIDAGGHIYRCSLPISTAYIKTKTQKPEATDEADGLTWFAGGRHVYIHEYVELTDDHIKWMDENTMTPVFVTKADLLRRMPEFTKKLGLPGCVFVDLYADMSVHAPAFINTDKNAIEQYLPASRQIVSYLGSSSSQYDPYNCIQYLHSKGVPRVSTLYMDLDGGQHVMGVLRYIVFPSDIINLIQMWRSRLNIVSGDVSPTFEGFFHPLIYACIMRDLSATRDASWRMAKPHDAIVHRCLSALTVHLRHTRPPVKRVKLF